MQSTCFVERLNLRQFYVIETIPHWACNFTIFNMCLFCIYIHNTPGIWCGICVLHFFFKQNEKNIKRTNTSSLLHLRCISRRRCVILKGNLFVYARDWGTMMFFFLLDKLLLHLGNIKEHVYICFYWDIFRIMDVNTHVSVRVFFGTKVLRRIAKKKTMGWTLRWTPIRNSKYMKIYMEQFKEESRNNNIWVEVKQYVWELPSVKGVLFHQHHNDYGKHSPF